MCRLKEICMKIFHFMKDQQNISRDLYRHVQPCTVPMAWKSNDIPQHSVGCNFLSIFGRPAFGTHVLRSMDKLITSHVII